jgi:hypothetical protein
MAAIRRAVRYARVWQPRRAREARLMWRRRPVGRIGAPSRGCAGSVHAIPAEPASVPPLAPTSNVIMLTWAQTFGRPARRAQ